MSTFVITAGHGGGKPGVVANGYTEAEVAAELRNMIAQRLRIAGHTVLTDGDGLVNLPLAAAIAMLAKRPLVGLEIHFNGSEAPKACGVETISLPGRKALAQRISAPIAEILKSPLRGEQGWVPQQVSPHNKLGFVQAGGLILETCFMTNFSEFTRYMRHREPIAAAITGVLING